MKKKNTITKRTYQDLFFRHIFDAQKYRAFTLD